MILADSARGCKIQISLREMNFNRPAFLKKVPESHRTVAGALPVRLFRRLACHQWTLITEMRGPQNRAVFALSSPMPSLTRS